MNNLEETAAIIETARRIVCCTIATDAVKRRA